jgi:hypothetical protein
MSKRKKVKITPDNADALFERDAASLIGRLTAYTRRWYGARCPDFDADCACCKAWQAVKLVKEIGP